MNVTGIYVIAAVNNCWTLVSMA